MDWVPGPLWCWQRCYDLGSELNSQYHPLHPESDFSNLYFCPKPYVAIQNLVPPPQIPIAMAIIIFCQNMGGAVFLIAANSIFTNGLRKELQKHIDEVGVSPEIILGTGLSSIRSIISGDKLTAALRCYTTAISHVMYLGIGVSVATFAFGWGLGWVDIRKVKQLQVIQAPNSEENVNSTTGKSITA